MTTALDTLNPFRYRGYVYDEETGLYYLRSRYYNPEWGRFINADTLLGNVGGLLSHNLFAYCGNSPFLFKDPSGHTVLAASIGVVTEVARSLLPHFTTLIKSISAAVALVVTTNLASSWTSIETGFDYLVGNTPRNQISLEMQLFAQGTLWYGYVNAVSVAGEKARAGKITPGTQLHHIVPRGHWETVPSIATIEAVGIDRDDPRNIVELSTQLHKYLNNSLYNAAVNTIISWLDLLPIRMKGCSESKLH